MSNLIREPEHDGKWHFIFRYAVYFVLWIVAHYLFRLNEQQNSMTRWHSIVSVDTDDNYYMMEIRWKYLVYFEVENKIISISLRGNIEADSCRLKNLRLW